jgi:hypothetical protein
LSTGRGQNVQIPQFSFHGPLIFPLDGLTQGERSWSVSNSLAVAVAATATAAATTEAIDGGDYGNNHGRKDGWTPRPDVASTLI